MARIKESNLTSLKESLVALGFKEGDFSVLGKENGNLIIQSGRTEIDDARLQSIADSTVTKALPVDTRKAKREAILAKAVWSNQDRDDALRMLLEESNG